MFNRIRGTGLPDYIECRIHLDATGCWIWRGARQKAGYGNVKYQKRYCRVHRLAYELLCGPIADGLVVHHKCGNKPCCNPGHLEPVSQRENVLRTSTAETERLAIVSWLRLVAQARDDRADLEWAAALFEAADFIERGEHHGRRAP